MNPNVLRQFLELYDKQRGSSGYNAQFDPYGALDLANKQNGITGDAARMAWAERMAGQGEGPSQTPNFFANAQQAAYQQPQQFHYDPARDAMPGMQQQPDPMMGRGPPRNYLTRGGRYG